MEVVSLMLRPLHGCSESPNHPFLYALCEIRQQSGRGSNEKKAVGTANLNPLVQLVSCYYAERAVSVIIIMDIVIIIMTIIPVLW